MKINENYLSEVPHHNFSCARKSSDEACYLERLGYSDRFMFSRPFYVRFPPIWLPFGPQGLQWQPYGAPWVDQGWIPIKLSGRF